MPMTCSICGHGELQPGTCTTTRERDNTVLVLKHVPALVCDNCGEEYLDEAIAEAIHRIDERAFASGAPILIWDWPADGPEVERAMTAYTVIYERGPRNWSAYVPDLPGCIAAGKDRPETERTIREAIEFHIEGLRLAGEAVPPPSVEAGTVIVTA